MADEQGKPDSISSSSIISRPIQDPSVILHWMNTAPLILEIKEKLEGARYWKEMDESGELVIKRQQFGRALLNEDGVNDIISFLESNVSHHTALGMFLKEENYIAYLKRTHFRLIDIMASKTADWNLRPSDIRLVCAIVMSLVERHSSRSLGDTERKHLTAAVESKETYVRQKEGFKIPFIGGR